MTYNMLVSATAGVMRDEDPSGVDAISRGMPRHTRRICADGDVYWLHGDHLGSAPLTTNITGAAVSEMRYYPFGETRWVSGTLPTDRLFTGQRELYLLSQFAAALEALSNHGVLGIDLFGTPEDLDLTIRFLRCMSVSGATTDGCR